MIGNGHSGGYLLNIFLWGLGWKQVLRRSFFLSFFFCLFLCHHTWPTLSSTHKELWLLDAQWTGKGLSTMIWRVRSKDKGAFITLSWARRRVESGQRGADLRYAKYLWPQACGRNRAPISWSPTLCRVPGVFEDFFVLVSQFMRSGAEFNLRCFLWLGALAWSFQRLPWATGCALF